jgi:hypothetical protein
MYMHNNHCHRATAHWQLNIIIIIIIIIIISNIEQVIKWRRTRWAGHVAQVGKERGMYKVLGGGTRGKETTRETQV